MAGLLYLVDDDPALRRLLKSVAAEAGWRVCECADGTELLGLLATGAEPALVVLDINMPEMDGITLLRSLSARSVRLALLFITGGAEVNATAARIIAESSGIAVVGHLLKPFPLDAFREMLRRGAETVARPV